MDDRKQLNVRIPIDLYNQVTNSDKPQVEIVVDAIRAYFSRQLLNAIFNDSTELSFAKESEFHSWFVDNFQLFGFNRIIKQSTYSFPDFILEYNGKEIRVELETLSSRFIEHGHDATQVDLVICLKANKELPVPIIEVPFRFAPKSGLISFTIRLDDELSNKIEAARGDKTKADFYRDIIAEHFKNREDNNRNHIKDIADLKLELGNKDSIIENKDNIIRIMGDRVKDLQQHNGFLVSEFTRINKMNETLLLPAPNKKWWKFWK